jgi:hypothetical protein
MKYLTLICDCGTRKAIAGADVEQVAARIDEAGWQDYPDDDRPLPKGKMHADCPTCLARMKKEESCP